MCGALSGDANHAAMGSAPWTTAGERMSCASGAAAASDIVAAAAALIPPPDRARTDRRPERRYRPSPERAKA
ncbi:MAG: hypothetical protein M1826_002489 [Phylliscum demangeonii]|nr:MAG: hypothetical protein M1826_002489 [Phylliscum demangeonii]